MHYISDLNDHPIEVTDLEQAIAQVEEYMNYVPADKKFLELTAFRKPYWTDMYNKLLQLKQQLEDNNNNGL